MRPTRLLHGLAIPVLAIAIAACGGGSPAASTGDGGNNSSSAPGASIAPASQAAASADSGTGTGSGDVDSVANALVPPNSSEITRTSASGGLFVGYSSTDSADSLKSFYENAIPGSGMTIFSTTSAGGSYSWVFAKTEGSSFGGSVTVGPSTDGGSGSSVIITLTSE